MSEPIPAEWKNLCHALRGEILQQTDPGTLWTMWQAITALASLASGQRNLYESAGVSVSGKARKK